MENVSHLAAFQQLIASQAKVIVHFWAPWCEPCKFLDSVLKQLSIDCLGVRVVRVEAEEAADISEKYQVSVVPYFLFFRDGQQVDSLEGADAAALSTKFAALAAGSVAGAAPAAQPEASFSGRDQPDVKERIRKLLASQPVMLFMKGSSDAPRCGFSRKVVEALQQCGAQFGTFDIMSDEAVRQGLKLYSNWPTYPQLYVNGELIGGCDIVTEMLQTGELKDVLAQVSSSEKDGLQPRLKQLVNSHPVMLFMKGTPDAPRCGFSRKVVEALRGAGEEFGSFDILSDEDVRQGLKEYSRWPTYPQLFVNGELLGGCDIVVEMQSAGELGSTIKEMKAAV